MGRVRTQERLQVQMGGGREEKADVGKDAEQWLREQGSESIHGGTGLKAVNKLSRLRSWRQQ